MQFDLTDFQLIIYIAETKNLTRAAERCFISTPAASNRIKNIETGLNIKLLERSSHGVELTQIGEIYLKYARLIYHNIDCLQGELASFSNGVNGKLTIAGNTTALTEYLPLVLPNYLLTHPNVQVSLLEKVSEQTIDLVLNRSVDIGIISGVVEEKGLQTLPLVTGRLVLIVPKDHPLSLKSIRHFKEAADYPFVSLPEGSAIQTFLHRMAKQLNRRINIRVQVTNYEAICQMVTAGVGIAIIPLSSFHRLHVSYPNLTYVSLEEAWAHREFRLCAIDFKELSKFSHDFIQNFIECMATLQNLPRLTPPTNV